MAFTGIAAGVALKLSLLPGLIRYFLMGMAIGLAVAGIELFVAGLLGELLAYVRNAQQRD